ncbi:ribonuclease H-like domain-containing protein [Tanacetum coccineum]
MNTIDHLGKFAGKSDEGFLVGYSLQSKAFRVYNLETKRVEENLYTTFLENKPNVAGKGPTWLFDLDYLTDSMNYHHVSSENQANQHAGQQEANQNTGTEDIIDVGDSEKEDKSNQDCFVLPIWPSYSSNTPALKSDHKREDPREKEQKFETLVIQEGAAKTSNTNIFSTVSTPAKASSTNLVNTVSLPVSTASPHEGLSLADPTNPEEDDSKIPPLEDIYQNSTDGIFTTSSYDDEGAVADFTNLENVMNVSPIPTSRIHSSHPSALILGDPTSAVQTRSKVNTIVQSSCIVSYVQKQKRTNHKDFYHCLFTCFLSQHEPKKISEALEDESWVDAMQEELLAVKDTIKFGLSRFALWKKAKSVHDWLIIYLTASRPDIKFAVCACSSFSHSNLHLSVVKRIFRKATTGGCQFVQRLISGNAKSKPLGTSTTVIEMHNMVAYLEKTEGNAEFHEIIDFLKRSSIHHALTHITTKVAIKSVSISSINKSGFLFDDADGIYTLPKQLYFGCYTAYGDEGASSERPSEAQPTPSPAPTSETNPSPRPSPSTIIPDSIPETSGGNLGGHSSSDKSLSGNEGEMTLQSVYDLCLSLCAQVSDQAKEIQHLKALVKKLKKQANPVIKHHRAWLQSVSLKQRLARKRSSKKQRVHKESVSKQGRKFAKGESSVQRDPLFDEIPEDTVDHMETENAQDEGRTRDIVDEDKEIEENVLSTKDVLIKPSTCSREKEKGVELKDIEETDRPKPTSTRSLLTLKPLLKIDPKDKGKKKIEEEDESESESEKIPWLNKDQKAIRDRPTNQESLRGNTEEVKKEIKEEVQEESKEEESKRKRKLGTRKKMKSRKRRFIQNTSDDDSDKESDELRLHLTIAPDEEKEVDYE